MHHRLKIWPQFFTPVNEGLKTFEVRENDRGFQMGDTVTLSEWNPETEVIHDEMGSYNQTKGYTGNEIKFRIGYVLPIDDKRVVFSLLKYAT